jgi:uncharacterized protein YcfL
MTYFKTMSALALSLAMSSNHMAMAQNAVTGTPAAVAAKLMARGDAPEVVTSEMRVVRRNDILTVQSDLHNKGMTDRMVFYRYRWLDNVGNQIGDGESWKKFTLMGQGQQTLKGVAPHSNATDFRLELSFEKK